MAGHRGWARWCQSLYPSIIHWNPLTEWHRLANISFLIYQPSLAHLISSEPMVTTKVPSHIIQKCRPRLFVVWFANDGCSCLSQSTLTCLVASFDRPIEIIEIIKNWSCCTLLSTVCLEPYYVRKHHDRIVRLRPPHTHFSHHVYKSPLSSAPSLHTHAALSFF